MATQRYLVTARKYRPQLFEELVAQEHVTETLKNAIRLDRLAHAYLFSGPRGVGKTTAARILAKAINCTTPLEERDGKAEPCRQCDSCRTFEEGRSLNIIEIDAASNNRVDDIRDLRETVRIPPQGGRKKVYIVDEVHMLSTAAFNALLKTLEEPPPHVLFIFATTEPHKVLPTILSRCQRFDFRRIAVPETVSRLREICREESITADEASLMLIARKGDGALRDALSVFDQAVSLCGSDLRYTELAQALGVVDVDLYFEVTRFVSERDSAGMLKLVDRIVRSGYDLQEFLSGLAEHLRNLVVARTMEDTSLIEAAEATRERYAGAVGQFTETDLLRLLTLASDAEESIKGAPQPRLRLETALLKMAAFTVAADLRDAISKIDRLEALAREGKIPQSMPATNDEKKKEENPSRSRDDAPEADEPTRTRHADERTNTRDADERNHTRDADERAEHATRTDDNGDRPTSSNTPEETASEQVPAPAGPPRAPERQTPERKTGDRRESESQGREQRENQPSESPTHELFGEPALKRKPPTSNAVAVADDNEADVAVAELPDAGPLAEIWHELTRAVTEDRIHVGSLLRHSRPEHIRDGVAVVGVPDDFHLRLLSHQEEYLLEQMKPHLSEPLQSLRFMIREELEAPASEETASDFDPYEYMQRKRQENPVIRAIFDQFGGELVW